jgi:hypothetical protein
MHKAVELILKRMESHPEEFVDARMKQMIEPYRQYLTTEEKEALKTKERDIHLDTLHVRVMKQILADKEEKVDAETYRTAAQQQALSQAKLHNSLAQTQWPALQNALGQAQLQGSQQGSVMQSANGVVTWASQPQPQPQPQPHYPSKYWRNGGIHYMLNSSGQVFYSKDNTTWKEL